LRPSAVSLPLALILLFAVVFAATPVTFRNTTTITSLFPGRWFDYVVVIMLENHSINYTFDNGAGSCLGNCTYYTNLANANGLAEGYTNTGSQSAGSVSNYVSITSGNGTLSPSCDKGVYPFELDGCSPLPIPNLVDRLEVAHLTWKAYMEGYPITSGCYNKPTGGPNYYVPNHNPFIYYSDIQDNAARCSHIVPANSLDPRPINATLPRCWPITIENDDLFINDLNSIAGSSNYMFLTPNTIDDNHDCNDVSVSNAWLQQIVPQILNSVLFRTKRAALFITFDEQNCTFTGCPPAAPQLYTVWASNQTNPNTKAAFKSTQSYTHFSALRTVEDNWALPPLVTSTDGIANNMQEFFL